MLNIIWLFLLLTGFIAAFVNALFLGDTETFSRIIDALFSSAKLAFDIALGLVGILCLWLGILKIAEKSGLVAQFARVLAPLFHVLMPAVPHNHPAHGHIAMNMAANFLGLDNAATPMGLKAMKSLQTLNLTKHIASDAQILFLVINTSSVTLFALPIFMYRAQMGADQPTMVFVPILLATCASTIAGILIVAWFQKISLLNKTIALYSAALFGTIGLLVFFLSQLSHDAMATVSSTLANGLLCGFILWILLAATIKKINVYDAFIEGAKEGFSLALTILPYLLAMLVAIAVFRASGILHLITQSLKTLCQWLHLDTAFIDALPTALMKPLSGSGSRAMMIDTMQTHGVDSLPALIAATVQGSTETTFYVLAVYFGSVGIQRIRHAAICGLAADFTGIVTAIFVCYWFF